MKWQFWKKDFTSIVDRRMLTSINGAIDAYFGLNVSGSSRESLMQAGRGAVYSGSTFISNTVASQELKLITSKPTRAKNNHKFTKKQKEYLISNKSGIANHIKSIDEVQEIEKHSVIDLLRNINSYTDGFKFMAQSEFQKCLCGNSYWYVIRMNENSDPLELHLLPPEQVIIKDKKGNESFRMIESYDAGKTSYKPFEIIPFSYVNPRVDMDNWKYGMSPLESVIAEYNISGKLKDLLYDFAKNKPGSQVFVETAIDKGNFTEEQKLAMKEAFKKFRSGNLNADQIMILDNGAKLTEIPSSAKDLPFGDNLRLFREFIFNAYQVPMSLVEMTGSNRAVQDRQDTQYLQHCIYPKLMMIQSTLNSFLIPMYKDLVNQGAMFVYENCIPEDEQSEMKLHTGYVQSGIKTINEVRADMELEAVDGGDVNYIQSTYTPITQAGQTPQQQGKEFAEGIKKVLE